MVDTVRTRAEILALLADNTSGDISPQDLRDMLVTLHGVYGGIKTEGGTTAQLLTATYAKVINYTGDLDSSGVTSAWASNQFTVLSTGIYVVNYFVSFEGVNPQVNEFIIAVDGVETAHSCSRKTTSTDIGSASCGGLISMTANQVVTTEAKNTGANITINKSQLYAFRIA